MAENKKIENAKKIEDNDLDKVSGGALFGYPVAKYNEAGIDVIGPGIIYNDGYILRASGEELDEDEANWGVQFYEDMGRPANSYAEIEKWFYSD